MDISQFAQLGALIAVLGTAVVYGTDVFCAVGCGPHWRASTTGRAAR
ncbi:hypothetical protein [Mycobacterium tilburgii]